MQHDQSIEGTGACPQVLFKAKPYEMQIHEDPIYMFIFTVSDAAIYTHKTLWITYNTWILSMKGKSDIILLIST